MATTMRASAAGRPRSKQIGMSAVSLPEVHPSPLDAEAGMAAEGLPLSRVGGDFAAAGGAPLSSGELSDLLTAFSALSGRRRQEAIACYLSASEGWDEVMKALGGAFATDAAQTARSG